MKKSKMIEILMLSFVPVVMTLGNSMLIPVLADLNLKLGISSYKSSLMISYFSFPAAIFIPFLGVISDRVGRKKILIPSLIIYGIGGGIAGIGGIYSKKPYEWILLGRILQGLGASGTSPMAMTLVSDLYTKEQRSKMLGIIEASNGLGKVISPLLGSFLAMVAWYLIFFSYPVFSLPLALGIHLWIKEPKGIGEHKRLNIYFKEIKEMVRGKKIALGICFFMGFLALFIMYGLLANFDELLGFSQKFMTKGVLIALPLLVMSLVSYWSGMHVKEFNHSKRWMIIYWLNCGVDILIVIYSKNYFLKYLAILLIGMSIGGVLTKVNIWVVSCIPNKKRGVITALYNSFRFLGIALGPVYFNDFLYHPLKLFFVLASIGSMILFLQKYTHFKDMLAFLK